MKSFAQEAIRLKSLLEEQKAEYQVDYYEKRRQNKKEITSIVGILWDQIFEIQAEMFF